MSKRLIKIGIILGIIIICIVNTSYGFTVGELTGDTSKFGDNINNVGGTVIDIISIIGSAAAVICMVILGIKYMAGSLEEKGQYKKSLLPYFIGAIFVFGASVIASMIFNIFN